jgi:hypothetical protein
LFAPLITCVIHPARAAMVDVGPSQALKLPGLAAVMVRAGDNSRIAAGKCTGCAIWRGDRHTIEGEGTGVILNGKPCAAKVILLHDRPEHHGAQSDLRSYRGSGS